MTVVTSLWASVQGDPTFMRRVNGWLTILWLLMIPVSLLTGWLSSVQYVSVLSLWALVSGHWSAWQAARVEVRQQEDFERSEQRPVEVRVVDALVEHTSLTPATTGSTSRTVRDSPSTHAASAAPKFTGGNRAAPAATSPATVTVETLDRTKEKNP